MRLTKEIWIATSSEIEAIAFDIPDPDIPTNGLVCVLNVANDLRGLVGWPDFEYAQIGLVDGPGNEVADYCAAVLMVGNLIRRHKEVIVYDHDGGRALAVGLMYLMLTDNRAVSPARPHCRRGLQHYLDQSRELAGGQDLHVHEAHHQAAEKIPFGLLEVI